MASKIDKWNKQGQITIFIIIALILIVLIALIFVIRNPPKIEIADEKYPQSYIEACTKEAVSGALKLIQEYGGDIEPGLSVMYKSINRTYLCYTSQYYKQCINQRPRLIEHIENQITDYITLKISECFDSLKKELEKRYDVEIGDMKLAVKLAPKEVLVDINRKFKMSREDKVIEFNNFKVLMVHPIYNLAEVSSEITNQEAQFCNFDSLGFMIIYPEYDITRFKTGDSDTIYSVRDRSSNQDFNFAIRSCVMPAGL